MNALKTLLAVSVLIATGGAQAAIVATYDYSLNGTAGVTPGGPLDGIPFTGTSTGSGTASLDDSGVLTLIGVHTVTLDFDYQETIAGTTTLFGSYAGGTFTPTSGQFDLTACDCGSTPLAYNSVSGSVLLSGGSINTVLDLPFGGRVTDTWTLTPTTPAVPVPAAAWLFGSGLLGLAGIARRRAA